ncbi:hypothetical protein INT45_013767 [Circinella minor]|uniref:Calcineurin-like phosphoesterase domain-containing protein n=1 Tax=Circinella minor TaxID=1195481 RepID=A0A8H7RXT0_9FUNG|nr:hypothetical protein INT45_013767 [Circinella minor]
MTLFVNFSIATPTKHNNEGVVEFRGLDITVHNDIGDSSHQSEYDQSIPMVTINNDPFFGSTDVHQLFAIGDVHGSIDELNELVNRIKYDYRKGDRIIFMGDLVDKGPDSVAVIRRAKELNAWCVRGNQDDVTLRMWNYLKQNNISPSIKSNEIMQEGSVIDPINLSDSHIKIASNMTDEDYRYLNSCPKILGIPALNSLFVHGGVDPRKSLKNQVPYFVMNMRSVKEDGTPTENRTKVNWADDWNRFQASRDLAVKKPYSDVYYGHDSKLGLQLKAHTFGLDSGCVFGNQLTALELRSRKLTQVFCKKYADHS